MSDTDIDPQDSLTSTFTPDAKGTYEINLNVSDGVQTDDDKVQVFACQPNVAPNADAGPNVAVKSGQEAVLDGSKSFDPDNGPSSLSFSWAFVSLPAGSALTNADIHDATTSTPRFTPDVEGGYILRLTVGDGGESDEDNALVFKDNTPPTINITHPSDGAFISTAKPNFTITFSDDDAGIDLVCTEPNIMSLFQGFQYTFHTLLRRTFDLMFPNTHNFPAQLSQFEKISLVTLPCCSDFFSPFIRQFVLPQREPPAMPEISIDKHDNLCLMENYIRSSRQVLHMF